MTKEGKVILNYKSMTDAPNDYSWQTDAELAYLMATNTLTIGFTDYLSEYSSQLHHRIPQKSQFAIKTIDGRHIGNCACYGINSEKSEAEIGIIIGKRHYWDQGYGTNAVISLVKYVFNHTNSIRIHLKTLEFNKRA
ncbi:MAG: GNAT family N-acetyltransferase [Dehalococcoidia bacterium]|nr:MAG: GNAT family N-acetyltransferase [Dehalococcoidia bacterium]